MKISFTAFFSKGIPNVVRSIRETATRRFLSAFRRERDGSVAPVQDAGAQPAFSPSEQVRRSKRFASLFPCLYNANHPHPVGQRHTCNDFLIMPRPASRRRAGRRAARPASMISFSVGQRKRGAA